MIKSSVYYSPESNKIVIMTRVYAESDFISGVYGAPSYIKSTVYVLIGIACDNSHVITMLYPDALKYFEYIGEL